MAHELEINDGRVSFAAVGAPAWHNLASVLYPDGSIVSVSEMLEAAFLSKWNVRTELWEIPDGYNASRPYVRIIRDNPHGEGIDILGQALKTYNPMQNEDLGTLGDAITAGGAYPETAGSIRGGREIFLTWKLPQGMVLDANGAADEVQSYLLLSTSHDGSKATRIAVTNVRTVCSNTLTLGFAAAKSSMSVRHTKNSAIAIDDAQRSLRLSFAYMDAFQNEAESLIRAEITHSQALDIFQAAYPMPDKDAGKAAMTKWEAKQDAIESIYGSVTCANIVGTAWGAYNALTENLDYGVKPRKGNLENVVAAASGFDAARNATRNGLLDVVKAVAFA